MHLFLISNQWIPLCESVGTGSGWSLRAIIDFGVHSRESATTVTQKPNSLLRVNHKPGVSEKKSSLAVMGAQTTRGVEPAAAAATLR